MTDTITTAPILTGLEAIEYAEAQGRTLCKYADPIEGARDDMTVDVARDVAAWDPSLIWVRIAAVLD